MNQRHEKEIKNKKIMIILPPKMIRNTGQAMRKCERVKNVNDERNGRGSDIYRKWRLMYARIRLKYVRRTSLTLESKS